MDWYEDFDSGMTEAALELPGVEAGKVSLKVEESHLVIVGHARVGLALKSSNGRYRMHERGCLFKRRLVLPNGITVCS